MSEATGGDAAAPAMAGAALDEADSIGEYSGSFDSDSSEEPVDEPHLKYERMGSDLALLLANEPATCLCVHPKLILVGTGPGRVHVFDHLGNRVRPARQPHSLCVNQISADEAGEHVASCSDDGTVCIHGLYSRDNSHSLTFDAPVKTVVLDPLYYRSGTGRRFAVGDSRVLLHEKTFLVRLRTTTIHEGDGTVQALSWRGPLMAWASDGGVRVYHTELKRVISLIRCDAGERPANHRCHLFLARLAPPAGRLAALRPDGRGARAARSRGPRVRSGNTHGDHTYLPHGVSGVWSRGVRRRASASDSERDGGLRSAAATAGTRHPTTARRLPGALHGTN